MNSPALLARLQHPWALSPLALAVLQDRLAHELHAKGRPHIASTVKASPKPKTSTRRGSIALIAVHGVLVHRTDEWSDIFGEVGYEDLSGLIRSAVANDDVSSIILHFSSPGGSAYGASECAAVIASAAAIKRTVAVVDPLAASGAYWLASQCSEVVITPSGECGSIGVYQLHVDQSKYLEEMGIKVTPVSVGKYKTATNPYEPLSDDGREQIESGIAPIYTRFVKAVAKGRGVSQTKVRDGFGEGGMLHAEAAVKEGMADRVGTFEETVDRVFRLATESRAKAEAAIESRRALLARDEAAAKKQRDERESKTRRETDARRILLNHATLDAERTKPETERAATAAVGARATDHNKYVAFHEAGHAVAAWSFGVRGPMTLTIVPQPGKTDGHFWGDPSGVSTFDSAVISLAGREAERLGGVVSDPATAAVDEAHARQCASGPAQLALARDRARALVTKHATAIKWLAGELLVRYTLDATDVRLAMGG